MISLVSIPHTGTNFVQQILLDMGEDVGRGVTGDGVKMADFMVRTGAGPGGRTRGDIIAVKDSGAPRGNKEGLPDYVWIECPSITRAAGDVFASALITEIGVEEVGRDGVDARVRLFNKNETALPRREVAVTDLLVNMGMRDIVIGTKEAHCACPDARVAELRTRCLDLGGEVVSRRRYRFPTSTVSRAEGTGSASVQNLNGLIDLADG